MTEELFLDTKIIGCETIREQNGLALSSRNTRIPENQKSKASQIFKAMNVVKSKWITTKNVKILNELLLKELKSFHVEYAALYDPETLELLDENRHPSKALIAIAIFLADVRLIDNLLLE